MDCVLLVPHLLRPPFADAVPRLPALETLLARGSRLSVDETAGPWLCRRFGIAKQQDWPIAPLTAQVDGACPGDRYWLRADPVHLRISRDRLTLAEGSVLAVSKDEAEALTAALADHFGSGGPIFQARHSHRWYVALDRAPRLATRPLPEVAGGDIARFLPTGDDAMGWQRIVTEVQMVLHEHPVNERREAAGELPVNSVWLWGGGVRPEKVAAPFDSLWGADSLARALAVRAGIPANDLPPDADAWLAAGPSSHPLVLLDSLRIPACYGDPAGWRDAVEILEARWFAPLARALAARRLASLTVVAVGGEGAEFRTTGRDWWKLWRRPKPLANP